MGNSRERLEAEGLIPGHVYELNVTIGPGLPVDGFDRLVTFGPVTADDDGEVEFEGDIELDPGFHRLDFFVTHNHPPESGVVSSHPLGAVLTGEDFLNRDPLLRCFPAVFLTIVADD